METKKPQEIPQEIPKEFSTTNKSNKANNAYIGKIIEALRAHKEHKINELKKLAEKMEIDFDDKLYTQIENLKVPEIIKITVELLKWLRDPYFKVKSGISNKFIKHKDFVEELFKRDILDKKYVINALTTRKSNLIITTPHDINEYHLELYQCKNAATNEPGQFQGIVIRLPNGIYQIHENDRNAIKNLFDYFVSLGFKK